MPPRRSHQEVEIKLRVQDIDAMHATLKRLCALQAVPRTYELNTLYDTASQSLRRAGRLMRIRVERLARSGAGSRRDEKTAAILTYKAPADSGNGRPRRKDSRRGRFKIKRELEVAVSDAAEMADILAAMGLCPSFRYEKFRTTYALPSIPGLKLELDETPVGTYLELEGSPRAIDRAARLLGYGPGDYSKATYGSLYLIECRRQGRKPGDMLFLSTEKRKKSR